VARSKEAKALGIDMQKPYFQIRHLIEQSNVEVFSSNYTLYADMSERLHWILRDFAERIETYSIDECFLFWKSAPLEGWPLRLRRSIALRGVGAKKEAFKYKKGERPKCLKFLDPKRQFRSVNRHDRSVDRQNLLALLSFVCHAPVCLVTELEHDYDA
jgi:hypothetical protein